MAKVTITLQDNLPGNPDGPITLSAEFDPPLKPNDEDQALTPAQGYAFFLLETAKSGSDASQASGEEA